MYVNWQLFQSTQLLSAMLIRNDELSSKCETQKKMKCSLKHTDFKKNRALAKQKFDNFEYVLQATKFQLYYFFNL